MPPGSLRALHPGSNPWQGAWQLGVGDLLDATVVRWVEKADRCDDAGGYLLVLRPAAFVMLCGQEAGRFKVFSLNRIDELSPGEMSDHPPIAFSRAVLALIKVK